MVKHAQLLEWEENTGNIYEINTNVWTGRNPRLNPMMQGKGIDRAFREGAKRNLVLAPAQKMGLLHINPTNRGADMVGKGLLNGTWWDVTTSGSWQSHVAKYGEGGIQLLYTLPR